MNNEFLAEIFSSEAFQNDYNSFLTQLEDTLKSDNKRKTDKLISHIMELVNKKKIKVHELRLI
jgi:hypothetical protein